MVKPVTTEGLESRFDRIRNFITPHLKRLLVVEDNELESRSITELLLHDDIEIVNVGTSGSAEALRSQSFDCCVLDLRLPDMSGFELLDQVKADPTLGNVPIVVFTGKDLSTEKNAGSRP